MLRWIGASVGGAGVAFGLFFLMQALVAPSEEPPPEAGERFRLVQFIEPPERPEPQPEEREPPEEPPPEDPPPPQEVSMDTPLASATPMDAPASINADLGSLPALGSGPALAPPGGGAEELIALQRVPPQYPHQAAVRGTEGWVKLAFTVTETGRVSNVRVVESEPPNVFDRAAVNALRRWRFKPQKRNGVNVARDATITLEFTLEK